MFLKEHFTALKGKRKIVMLTAYDVQVARILSITDIDLILVGDSLGVVFQGHPNTQQVTMDEMIYHTKAVVRGAGLKPVIGDMPINSYSTEEQAVVNAKRFIEAGAKGVKIEGSNPPVVKALFKAGIEVMGHVGLLPQTAQVNRVQGKTAADAEKIFKAARELDKGNVFSIVLECVPEDLAKRITESLSAPTIGIGAGVYCDGQVLVINDMLGMDDKALPKFVKQYAGLAYTIQTAVSQFTQEVRAGTYPDSLHTYH
jgi:3-methyl-2-oxobutanoate hydroxymethyltransferase